MEKLIQLPASTLNKVVGYISTKPYREVALLLSEVDSKAKPCKPEFPKAIKPGDAKTKVDDVE